MTDGKIKTIQNLLKIQKRFDLAVKFEHAYYEHREIEEGEYNAGMVTFYVNPIYFFEMEAMKKDEKELILKIVNALNLPYDWVKNVTFSINENIPQSDIRDSVYIFVDESGDMDFSLKGSNYYMFNFLVKTRPFQLHEYIANYRYELIERTLLDKVIDIEAFHACEDNKYVRQRVFEIIGALQKKQSKYIRIF